MRIALVHPKFDRSGGAERYALGLAEGLLALGHEVHLFGRRAQGFPAGAVFRRVWALPLGRALKTWSFCRAAGRTVRANEFAVVQGFGKTTCQSVHRTGGGVHRAYLEQQRRNRLSLYDRVVLAIEDALFASSHLKRVVCPSAWVAREAERFYPGAAPRTRIIPNGVDVDHFVAEGRGGDRLNLVERIGVPRDAPILLFVATNFPLKGLGTAVEFLGRIEGAHLVVAGGDAPGPFVEMAQARGVAERAHFLGAVADPAPLYRAADLLVHPTLYDPFANVCLEALACGTPVVTTDANGAADVLQDPAAGAVVPLGSTPGVWADRCRALLKRGPAGRAAARSLALAHSREKHVAAVAALYEEVASGTQEMIP